MMTAAILLIPLVAPILVLLAMKSSLVIIKPNEVGVLRTLGRFDRILPPGVNIVKPFISVVHPVNVQDQVLPFRTEDLTTKDGVDIDVKASLIVKVEDAEDAFFEVTDHRETTVRLAKKTIASVVSDMEYWELMTENGKVSYHIKEVIDNETDIWGVKVKHFGIDEVQKN